jgi:nitrogen fixation-related uncharacterized protein
MATLLVAIVFLAVGFVFMAWALHFSQYKKKQQSCCSDALEPHEQIPAEKASCFTCPRRQEKDHVCEEDPDTCDHELIASVEPAQKA